MDRQTLGQTDRLTFRQIDGEKFWETEKNEICQIDRITDIMIYKKAHRHMDKKSAKHTYTHRTKKHDVKNLFWI